MLQPSQVQAITLDLDDTLWPIWPTIAKAEKALGAWFTDKAPATGAFWSDAERRRLLREQVVQEHEHLAHDMAFLRRESIRRALVQAGDDEALAAEAFDVFIAKRHEVELYEDALEALEFLAARFPLVAVSNGNADLGRIGLMPHFRAAFSATTFGVGKPDARIFLAAAEAAGVPPQAVLHVGDDALLDVLGAHAVGMQTAWINRGEHPWTQAVQPHATLTDLRGLCALFS
ncbi:HAD family hydrolase [Pseudorhodoferax sp. LjRoot39]|uniref:HAD family hydrolase n=1 Tax=Pseudorhodoferax sp. LjRoot39 TaxID=3342328 RepID=UPI003ECF2966